jgi:hypothetical protein
MKTIMVALSSICVLALSGTAFADDPVLSNASLTGVYALNLHKVAINSWYAPVSCPNQTDLLLAGTEASQPVDDGTITFDGIQRFTYSGYKYGPFDQAASNETTSWGCNAQGYGVITSAGYAVYDHAVAETFSGTYSVLPDGTGLLEITGDSSFTFSFRLARINAKGVAAIVLVHEIVITQISTPGLLTTSMKSVRDGIAVKRR